ncbi:conserved hypothetical protein [Pediculus humanus corporis]|uniref:SWI/SNF-related matrix-associated actin-dependent regulator of chromatin subfamily A containing DEAD/H box 1 homolog n=1 Tax=Pediculus humanus subsp. corporis TaxID=121224 RepID=E0VIU3_PEDHC|nr:uncharacterized protein Phum_PHUM233510 [Pediculus humanus corporis]EEB13299.1 conserved hypothetical protein [Pediculus humanus corporis]
MSNSIGTKSSQNLLSNLRHFRFQKKNTNHLNNDDNPDKKSEPDKKPSQNCDSNQRLFEEKILERSLIKCKGDVEAAKSVIRKELNLDKPSAVSADAERNPCFKNQGVSIVEKLAEKCSPVKRPFSATNGESSVPKAKKYKRVKNTSVFDESEDSEDEIGFKKQDQKVYDSEEDSDVEITDDMNTEQRKVYEFLSTAELSELLCMPNCSQKKAEAILDQRPFSGWKNMVEKFQEGKNLGTEILNYAQEVLYTRQVVNQLMQKCSRLAIEMEKAVSAGTSNVTVQPKLLNENLKLASYQMVGLNWLLVLHHKGLNGILADEMGLGKTVQIIAFLAYLQEMSEKNENGDGDGSNPHLIVVPSSTMDNWRNELERWCPSLKVFLYYGSMDERKAMRIQFSQHGIKDLDVILTTYNLITSTSEEKKMFKVLPFNYVIFDEAHMLKNMNTQRFENLMRVNAKHRILLTGTPLQNNLLELMSLLTFVMPEMFAKKKEYLKCLFTRNKTNGATIETIPKFEQEQVSQAKKIMQPFVLRRLKKDVLKDLPKKTEEIIYCEMIEKQKFKYENLISTFSKKTENKNTKEDIDEVSGLSMMMDLRKLSNHPLLLREIYDENKLESIAKILAKEKDYKETNVGYIIEDLSVMSDYQIHALCKSFKSLSEYELKDEEFVKSGKFQKLDEMLPKLKEENHRVLIFSQFVIMLDVMEEYLRIRGHKYLRLDGSTQVIIRQELIDAFNEDSSIFVFILSTRAGGLGINLTAADTVIIHDMDFNPYNDKQAEDRCHRVGQTKPVSVYKFIGKNTIEENIHQVALEKLNLEKKISSEESEQSERKSVVSLLKQALGFDNMKISPQKKPQSGS